jgi:hypothetical protein
VALTARRPMLAVKNGAPRSEIQPALHAGNGALVGRAHIW